MAEPITEDPWTSRSLFLAIASILGFSAIATWCWQSTGTVVPWDSKNHFYPMFRFLADALHRGEVPFWNPYIFAGHPAIADPQSLVFTPSMLLFAWLAPDASMQAFDLVILAHLGFGGLCMLGLARHWGWHPVSAVLTALIFMLGGAASARLQHTGMILSYSFFPAALWSLELMLERHSWRCALLFGLAGALMALGRDQVAFLLCAALVARVIVAAAQSGAMLAYLRARTGVLAVGGFLAIAILAVPVLLTMQFLAESNRPGIAFGMAAAGSLAPENLITLVAPNFFGSLDHAYDYWGPEYETMARPDFTDRAINYLFIGTFPILLVLWHGLAAGRIFERRLRFLGVLLAVALVYSLGRNTPLFALAFDLVPGVSLYRRPADATFLVNIALAGAAGHMLHRYIESGSPSFAGSRPFSLMRMLATLGGIGALIVASLAFSFREDHLWISLGQLALAAASTLACASVLLARPDRRLRVLAACFVVGVTSAEILWRNAASALNAEPAERYSVLAGMRPGDAAGLERLRRAIAADLRHGERPRVEILGLGGPWQNAAMVLKLEDTLGYNPLRINDYEKAVGASQNSGDPNLRRYPGLFRGYKCRLASLLGLEYLVLDRPLTRLPRHIPRPQASPIYTSDSLYIYKLGDAMPRVYFASRIKPIDSEEIFDEQALPDFDRSQEVLIDRPSLPDLRAAASAVSSDGPSGLPIRKAAAESVGARLAIVEYSSNKVVIDADIDKTGIVVLHDLFYPGWEARVDGVREPVLHANILFRGVEVGAGRHRIEFTFEPLSFANLAAAASSIVHRKEN